MESYVQGTSKVHTMDRMLHSRKSILCTLKDNLVMTQNQMKQQANQYRSKCSFAKGDEVFHHL